MSPSLRRFILPVKTKVMSSGHHLAAAPCHQRVPPTWDFSAHLCTCGTSARLLPERWRWRSSADGDEALFSASSPILPPAGGDRSVRDPAPPVFSAPCLCCTGDTPNVRYQPFQACPVEAVIELPVNRHAPARRFYRSRNHARRWSKHRTPRSARHSVFPQTFQKLALVWSGTWLVQSLMNIAIEASPPAVVWCRFHKLLSVAGYR